MIKRSSWMDALAARDDKAAALGSLAREALAQLDQVLYETWNLGENVILAWTREDRALHFLAVRHYAIIEAFEPDARGFINEVLAGPKMLPPVKFESVCRALGAGARVVGAILNPGVEPQTELISNLVTRYGVSLVRERAVALFDAVGFSLRSPLEQVAMLNSLSYSVNSAYRQLLSKDVRINFARTTTGDGFYIWNRVRSAEANLALYKLMMLVLADNAVARRKAKRFPVPKLRAAFHVGEHYEFYQVEALNPTSFCYIVGQVTIDLSRMIEKALPDQILLGEFKIAVKDAGSGRLANYGTREFVEKTQASLHQLKDLEIAGDHIKDIRCYLTGERVTGGEFLIKRFSLQDKHGVTRPVYNAKINIHPRRTEPIFLGIQHDTLHPRGAPAAVWP